VIQADFGACIELAAELRQGGSARATAASCRHADLAVAVGDRNAQRIANGPHVLVARPKQGQNTVRIDQRNCRFAHSISGSHPLPRPLPSARPLTSL
jgi:hypothetical protein